MKFKAKLLLLPLVSASAMALALLIVSYTVSANALNLRIEETLQTALDGFNYDVGQYKNWGSDIELTVFEGDTRSKSSIPDVVGTKASQEVIDVVLNQGQEYFTTDVVIGGEDYYGYYRPTTDGMIFAGKPQASVKAILRTLGLTLFGITVAFLAMMSVIIVYAATHMSRALSGSKDSILTLSELNLTRKIDDRTSARKDEFGDMGRAIDSLQSSLYSVVGQIDTQSGVMGGICENFRQQFATIEESTLQISTAMEEVAQGGTVQAQETTQMNTDLEHMAGAIDTSIGNITTLNGTIKDVADFAGETRSVLQNLSAVSDVMTSSINDVASQIAVTNQSMAEISKAVEMIQDIASQTNLLSINASIEAAHAGDAGKGFAVVADEIKKLSDNSAESARFIEKLIKDIVKNVTDCETKMESVDEDVSKQKSKLEDTVKAFDKLQDEIAECNVKINSIAEQIDGLSVQKDSVGRSSEQLAAIAQENAASTQEVSASLQSFVAIIEECRAEINNLASAEKALEEEIDKFKL